MAEAQYYSPRTYIPLSCSNYWTAECESAARMTEIQTQQEVLKAMNDQNFRQQQQDLNEQYRQFGQEPLRLGQ
jgi:hypothetical protein